MAVISHLAAVGIGVLQLDDRNRTIINLDSYEAMAMYYAMKKYMDNTCKRK